VRPKFKLRHYPMPTPSLRCQFVVVTVDLGVDPAGHDRKAGASERAPERDLGGANFGGDVDVNSRLGPWFLRSSFSVRL
jgi:hypothetical protein